MHRAAPLHVLLVSARYLPYSGGIELHVHQIARRLAGRGVDVTILTTDLSGSLPSHERVNGAEVVRVRAWPSRRDYYFAPRLYREIVKGRWDVVHIQGYQTLVAPIAMLAALRSSTPYVLTFHGGGHSSRVRHALRPVQLMVLRPLLTRAARLITVAPHEAQLYGRRLRLPETRFSLVVNGSDLPAAPTGRPERDASLIASPGRLERYKGHHRVLTALPHILARRPDARLWVAGRGPFEPTLKKLASDLGITEHVAIRAVPDEDRAQMANELAKVKVAVSFSEFETHPVAMLEALSLGCRLVVADTPGLRPLADQGYARAIPLRSRPEEIARVVLEELERPAPTDVPSLATWDDCASGLLDLYEEVVHELAERPLSSDRAN